MGALWGHFEVTLGSLWGHFGITLAPSEYTACHIRRSHGSAGYPPLRKQGEKSAKADIPWRSGRSKDTKRHRGRASTWPYCTQIRCSGRTLGTNWHQGRALRGLTIHHQTHQPVLRQPLSSNAVAFAVEHVQRGEAVVQEA